MELSNLKVNEFTALLGSEAPAPGGGSAAALCGALGAALSAMVSALTVGSAKFEAFHETAGQALAKADGLRQKMLEAMEADTAAFNQVSAAFSLPKSSDEEKAARSQAIQEALAVCTESPLDIMALSVETLELTLLLIGRSNTNAASDLGVSALCLKAGLQGAWLNVLINVGSLKDKEKAEGYRARGESLLNYGLGLADEIYEQVEKSLA